MWKQNLNLETLIVVKEASEIEDIRKAGDYDMLRRGVVLPAHDEIVNLESVLGSAKKMVEKPAETPPVDPADTLPEQERPVLKSEEVNGGPFEPEESEPPFEPGIPKENFLTLTEEDAIFELRAIPLYFPMSYSLVKPFIHGFEANGLDAPSLKEVSIDNNWQPKQ